LLSSHTHTHHLQESRIGVVIAKLLKHSDAGLRTKATSLMQVYKAQIAKARGKAKASGGGGPLKKKTKVGPSSATYAGIPTPSTGFSERRMKMRKIFADLFSGNGQLAADLEDAVFAQFRSATVAGYTDRLRSLRFNLKKNESLCAAIVAKRCSITRLMEMKPDEMISKIEAKERKEANEELFASVQTDWIDHNREALAKQAGIKLDESRYIICPRCKSEKTSFFQKQTRSADEPMTNFCTCHNTKCGHKWRFC
jgi:transcription elongation factor S-II